MLTDAWTRIFAVATISVVATILLVQRTRDFDRAIPRRHGGTDDVNIIQYFSTRSLKPGQFNRIEIQTTGNFTKRIMQFNADLSRIRRVTLEQRGGLNGSWKNEIGPNNITVILGLKDGYQMPGPY